MNSQVLASIRYPIIAGLAVIVTYSLFLMMYQLTSHPDRNVLTDRSSVLRLDFIRLQKQQDQEQVKRRLPPPKPIPKKQPKVPPLPQQQVASPIKMERRQIVIPPGNLDVRGGFDANLFGSRGVAPLVRVQPIYPMRAQRRGIEGWVEVEFTIAEDGRVLNPHIVAAEPSGTFDQATLKAVSRWRYQPQVIDGQPIRRPGIRVIIEFKLEQQ